MPAYTERANIASQTGVRINSTTKRKLGRPKKAQKTASQTLSAETNLQMQVLQHFADVHQEEATKTCAAVQQTLQHNKRLLHNAAAKRQPASEHIQQDVPVSSDESDGAADD
jgi:antirestriction protein ArdC